MLFSLISMNKMLNQNKFRVYPKAGPTRAGGTGCAVTSWNRHSIRLALPDVAERRRCRKMFAVQSHERSPGSRRSSRSRRDVDEVVVQGASSRVKTLPKNLIARIPCRTFSEQRFRRPALARAVRAALAMGTAESSRGRRERSPKQEYLKQVLVV